jgi:hypothetical protein
MNFLSKSKVDSDYKIDLLCLNCKRIQEVVILKGVTVKMAMDAGRDCSYCGCKIAYNKEGNIPYASW